MAEELGGLTTGAQRLLKEIADKHRQRLPDVGRRTRRLDDLGDESGLRAYKITTVNCILDGFNLAVGTTDDDDSRPYVLCKPVDPITDEVPDGAAETELYCNRGTVGFVFHGLIVYAKKDGGKLTAKTAAKEAWGEYVSADGDLITVNLFADQTGFEDWEVEVEAAVKCGDDPLSAPTNVGQHVKVAWEHFPSGDGVSAGLFVVDRCCPA